MATLRDWLPLISTITAALIAGIFAVYQLGRTQAAQRELGRESSKRHARKLNCRR